MPGSRRAHIGRLVSAASMSILTIVGSVRIRSSSCRPFACSVSLHHFCRVPCKIQSLAKANGARVPSFHIALGRHVERGCRYFGLCTARPDLRSSFALICPVLIIIGVHALNSVHLGMIRAGVCSRCPSLRRHALAKTRIDMLACPGDEILCVVSVLHF